MKCIEQDDLELLAEEVGSMLRSVGTSVVTAESCTGGWIAQCLTSVSGSSAWFERGYVSYSNEAKQELLGVPAETILLYGAVSEATAAAMASGALCNSHAEWSLAVTGIAGPAGGTPQKPVGTVCFAWCSREGRLVTETCWFDGDRREIRARSVAYALTGLLKLGGTRAA
jgi:nicotinamide-nucleotide amidase